MARRNDDLADSFATEDSGSWLARFLADEGELDARAKWRLGTWAVGSVGALVVAILASQSATQSKREQLAAADLARQSQMIQRLAKQSQSESSRLASAIETLNSDRDRLFSRLGTLEQGLDSVTGSIARVQAAASPPAADKPPASDKPAAAGPPTVAKAAESSAPASVAAAPSIAPVESRSVAPPASAESEATKPAASKAALAPTATAEAPASRPDPGKAEPVASGAPPQAAAPKTVAAKPIATTPPPAGPLMPSRSLMAPPDPAATKLVEVAPAKPEVAAAPAAADEADSDEADTAPIPVQRTQFGVDLGSANTIDGLRTLWHRLSKSSKQLSGLRPIIMVKERDSGNGTQLRLVAGPLDDAAAAAKLCASFGGGKRFCETSVFDGQRLPGGPPAPAPRSSRRPSPPKVTSVVPEPPPPPAPPKPASFTSFLGLR